jgi:hypothetical protein
MNITITHNRYIYIMKIMLQLQSSAVFSYQSRTGPKLDWPRSGPVRTVAFFGDRSKSPDHIAWRIGTAVLGGRLVRSGVIYWSQCVEGLIVMGVVYIGC